MSLGKGLLVVIVAAGILLTGTAWALINPNFPPGRLIENADLILALKIIPADGKDQCQAEVVNVFKGKMAAKTLVIDLSKSANTEQTKALKELVASLHDEPAMFFVGKGEEGDPVANLHLGGKWVSMNVNDDPNQTTWSTNALNSKMQATWAGGTDMLRKLTELIIKHPETDVPVASPVSWDDPVNIGKIAGKAAGAMAVDIAGAGELCLYVAADDGDKVFKYDKKAGKFADVTTALKLGSKSRVAAWGNFNGAGRLDLASWDGKALTLWIQAADGTFAASVVTEVPKGDCIGLVAMDAEAGSRAGLLWSTAASPVLLVPNKDNAGFTLKPLPAIQAQGLGAAGACLTADFDGDGLPDVIQPFAKGSFFFKGDGKGGFAPAVPCAISLGEGRSAAFLGDFDGDGRIDVFVAGADGCSMWQNSGGGKFTEMLNYSGEIAYISKPGAIGGNTCDVNNDGRQDIFILYAEIAPQIFFNRGFRSTGHAHKPTDLGETNVLPGAINGTQAGVVADLTAHGAQDMALVLLDGTVWVLPQSLGGESGLAVRVGLAHGACAGPVTITAHNSTRSLGAWALSPGGEAFLGTTEAGDITFSWQIPGQAPQEKTIALKDKPVYFRIPAGK